MADLEALQRHGVTEERWMRGEEHILSQVLGDALSFRERFLLACAMIPDDKSDSCPLEERELQDVVSGMTSSETLALWEKVGPSDDSVSDWTRQLTIVGNTIRASQPARRRRSTLKYLMRQIEDAWYQFERVDYRILSYACEEIRRWPKLRASSLAGNFMFDVREVAGNPFRPVEFSPTWRTSNVVALASGMYDTQDFSPMPILADALQDAGCKNEEVLNHCSGLQNHFRGCWVIEEILGRR